MFKKFYILHFTFYIIITPLLLVILSCTTSTDVSKGSLIGSVALENETDYSGISVSLYELAYLDTTITRINSEYPHIGVIINQHTEFDHRLQTPIKTGTTAADGSFELKNIPTGIYNFVAQKAGYGFRYIHEISISEGENLLSEELKIRNVKSKMKKPVISTGMEKSPNFKFSILNFPFDRSADLTLYPELHRSGDISEEVVVEPYHHLVCDDDVTFVPDSRLEIQPNAVVRIAPGADLTIMGNFKAQGEEDNMFWVTSNDGFENDELLMFNSKLEENYDPKNNSKLRIKNLKLIGDSLALYNSMQLSPLATVEDDLIEWGKWDWGNTCLLNQVDNLTMQNGIFRNGEYGLENHYTGSIDCSNINVLNFQHTNKGGIDYYSYSTGSITKCLLISSEIGFMSKFYCEVVIENNFFKNNYNIKNVYYSNNIITKNNFYGNLGILVGGDSYPEIFENNFNTDVGIHNSPVSYGVNSNPSIHFNNFYCSLYSIKTTGGHQSPLNVEIDAINNFWNTEIIDEIETQIYDKNDVDPVQQQYYGEVIFQPFLTEPYPYAGIQGE